MSRGRFVAVSVGLIGQIVGSKTYNQTEGLVVSGQLRTLIPFRVPLDAGRDIADCKALCPNENATCRRAAKSYAQPIVDLSLRGCEFIACRRGIPSPTAAKLAILSAKGFASYN